MRLWSSKLILLSAAVWTLSAHPQDVAAAPVAGPAASPGPILFLAKTAGPAPDGDWELHLTEDDFQSTDRLTFNTDRTIAWVDAIDHGDGTATLVLATKRWGDQFNLLTDAWESTTNATNNAVNGPMQRLEILTLDRNQDPPALVSATTLIETEDPEQSLGFRRLWHPTFNPNIDSSGPATPEIVFAAALPGEMMNLWTLEIDGSGLTRIIDDPMRTANDPSWGVDGWIYYAHSVDPGEPINVWNSLDVWRIEPTSGVRLRVTDEDAIPGNPRADFDPVLSPGSGMVLAIRSEETIWTSISAQSVDGSDPSAVQSHIDPWRIHGVAHFESPTQFIRSRLAKFDAG